MPHLENLTDAYLATKADPAAALGRVGVFDELRKETYLATIERAHKEKDPESEYAQLSQVFGQMKKEMGYFVGKEKYGDRFNDLEREDRLETLIGLGTKLMEDRINPSGSTGQRRRRR